MKKLLLITSLLCVVIVSNSYKSPKIQKYNNGTYNYKTLEIMYDSKKRPHRVIIYKDASYNSTIAAIDLDAGTYINK